MSKLVRKDPISARQTPEIINAWLKWFPVESTPESPAPKVDNSLGVFFSKGKKITKSLPFLQNPTDSNDSKENIHHKSLQLCCISSLDETLSLPAPPDLAGDSAVSQDTPSPTPPVRSSELCIGSWPDQARYPVEPGWIGSSSASCHHHQSSLDSAPSPIKRSPSPQQPPLSRQNPRTITTGKPPPPIGMHEFDKVYALMDLS
jgi:hypothetical protein